MAAPPVKLREWKLPAHKAIDHRSRTTHICICLPLPKLAIHLWEVHMSLSIVAELIVRYICIWKVLSEQHNEVTSLFMAVDTADFMSKEGSSSGRCCARATK